MEKRLFLAILLSIFVLMIYSSVASRFAPEYSGEAPMRESPVEQLPAAIYEKELAADPNEVILPDFDVQNEELLSIQKGDLVLEISPNGSAITSCYIKSYDTKLPQVNLGLLAEWQKNKFSHNFITDGIAMSYVDVNRGLEIKKVYRFTQDEYIIEMDVIIVNNSAANSYVKYNLNIGSMSEAEIKKNPMDQRYIEFSISLPDKVLRNNFLRFNPKSVSDTIQWAGMRDRYFCSILLPLQESGGLLKSNSSGLTSYILQLPVVELLPGQSIKHSYLAYIGPQKQEFITPLGKGAESIINFGIFDFLGHIFLGVFKFLFGITKNWGLVIILFSVGVFLVMSPLSIKSFSSMKKMQELQPLIEELKVKYKDSPQKMQKEVMEMYREKKVNPLGGCLPLVLQMPIFISLYQTLMRFIDLKGAQFLWIKDLSEPDRLLLFKNSFPVIGNEFNLLPIIMIITMLVQQKITGSSKQSGGSSAQQQKMMSLFMAVFFGIIFYHMPSGLVLYWSVNSILMLVFQMRMFGSKQKA